MSALILSTPTDILTRSLLIAGDTGTDALQAQLKVTTKCAPRQRALWRSDSLNIRI